MAWTSPRTWVVGETLTAALLNTHIRDNENWLATDSPRCSAIRTATQSVLNATNTVISLTGTDEFDTAAMHDPAGGTPSRVIVPSGGQGLYQVNANIQWAVSTGGEYDLLILKNGVQVPGCGQRGSLNIGGNAHGSASVAVQMVATDYVEIQVAQNQGSALNVSHARLQAIWLKF